MIKPILRNGSLPLIVIIAAWMLTMFVIPMFSDAVLFYAPSFPYALTTLAKTGLPKMIYSWANFDGVHYLMIAEHGYLSTALIQAFFPVFPLLLSLAPLLQRSYIAFGLLLNVVMAAAFLLIWFDSLQATGNTARTSLLTVLAFLSFPSSFFLLSLYSESLFLVVIALVYVSIQKKRWLLAALLVGVASGTRLVGVLLVPAILFAYCSGGREITVASVKSIAIETIGCLRLKWKQVIGMTALGMSGLLAYMYFLYRHFSDPFYFFHVQAEFGAGREESIVLLPQVFFRYIKILITYRPIGLAYYSSAQELLLTCCILVGLYFAWKKRLAPQYQILFSFAAVLLPTLTGTLSSMPRYVLVALPAFSAIAWILERYPRAALILIGCSTFLLVFNTILFIQGYWVA